MWLLYIVKRFHLSSKTPLESSPLRKGPLSNKKITPFAIHQQGTITPTYWKTEWRNRFVRVILGGRVSLLPYRHCKCSLIVLKRNIKILCSLILLAVNVLLFPVYFVSCSLVPFLIFGIFPSSLEPLYHPHLRVSPALLWATTTLERMQWDLNNPNTNLSFSLFWGFAWNLFTFINLVPLFRDQLWRAYWFVYD